MRTLLLTILVVVICVGAGYAETKYGKDLTLEETTDIATVNKKPTEFADQDLVVTGKVVDMCRHRGCWVMLEADDEVKAQILCRSLDESVQFPVSVMGQLMTLQGKLLYDKEAPGEVWKSHEGEEPHACPNPQVMVSIHGATVDVQPVSEEAPKESVIEAE